MILIIFQAGDKCVEVEVPVPHFGGKQCHGLGVVALTPVILTLRNRCRSVATSPRLASCLKISQSIFVVLCAFSEAISLSMKATSDSTDG